MGRAAKTMESGALAVPMVTGGGRRPSERDLARLVERVLGERAPLPPRADVYGGAMGLALLALRVDITLKQRALDQAERLFKRTSASRTRMSTFLTGEVALYALLARQALALGQYEHTAYLLDLLRTRHLRDVGDGSPLLPDELLYGRAGSLHAVAFARLSADPLGRFLDDNIVARAAAAILRRGAEFVSERADSLAETDLPICYEWHGKQFLGIAHGVAGIVYTLIEVLSQKEAWLVGAMRLAAHDESLGAKRARERFLALVTRCVEALARKQRETANGNLPTRLGEEPKTHLVQWCHGVPGAVLLYLRAYELVDRGRERWLEYARAGGELVFQHGVLRKGRGLCHGTAGNGLVLLKLYRADTESGTKWLDMACAMWAAHSADRIDGEDATLFGGLAGWTWFVHELCACIERGRGHRVVFPGLDLF